MQLFVITSHCTSKLHCKTCRNKEGGRKWRADLSKNFDLPDGLVDFDCPYGIPWDIANAPKPLSTTPMGIERPQPLMAAQSAPSTTPESTPTQENPVAPRRERSGTRGGCGCGRG